MKYVALSLVFLFACKERSTTQQQPAPQAPARSDVCTTALASFDRYVDTGDPDATPDQRAQVKAAVLDRCITDNWSEPALTCMRNAGTSHDVFKCWTEQLTPAQRDAASKALGSLKQ